MYRAIRSLVIGLIGARRLGRLDYILQRRPKDPFGGPFNGQVFRRRIYADIMDRLSFNAIVETGTYRGSTTELFADSGLPVYSVEIDSRAQGFATQRLSYLRDRVHLFQGNSPDFLRELANRSDVPDSDVFFYLDAHVQNEKVFHSPPLVEELEIIFNNWKSAVVMVDDFHVSGTNYGFDDWGPGRILDMALLEPLNHFALMPFFPSADPKDETGGKRGCVVLCREKQLADVLREIRTLRPGSDS